MKFSSTRQLAHIATLLLIISAAAQGSGPLVVPKMPEVQSVDICSDAPPIKVIKWFKGTTVTQFQPGHIYVVEFWATWCVPCREAMPHLTELAKKFGDKVTFVGVDVWEQPDDLSNDAICSLVGKFVAEKGDAMGYAVAADGADHFMFKNWLLAAHRMNIPSTFIIGADGKVALIGHPMEMDPILDQVVNGKWDAKGELARLQNEREAAKRRRDLMAPVFEAYQAKDYKKAVARLDEMAAAHADMAGDSQVRYMRFDCLVRTDPSAAFAYLKKLCDENAFHLDPGLAYGIAQTALANSTTLQHGDYTLLISAMEVGRRETHDNSKNFLFMTSYSEALFRDGQIDKAVMFQQQTIADATPNIGHGVGQDWVDEQTKRLNEYKAAKH